MLVILYFQKSLPSSSVCGDYLQLTNNTEASNTFEFHFLTSVLNIPNQLSDMNMLSEIHLCRMVLGTFSTGM